MRNLVEPALRGYTATDEGGRSLTRERPRKRGTHQKNIDVEFEFSAELSIARELPLGKSRIAQPDAQVSKLHRTKNRSYHKRG